MLKLNYQRHSNFRVTLKQQIVSKMMPESCMQLKCDFACYRVIRSAFTLINRWVPLAVCITSLPTIRIAARLVSKIIV